MDLNYILQGSKQFRYMVLDRMLSDCKYYLGAGGRNRSHLFGLNEEHHISGMKAIWDSFSDSEKPEWLSRAELLDYEADLCRVTPIMTLSTLSQTASFELLRAELNEHELMVLEYILSAYSNGQIELELIRDEDERLDFDRSFSLIIHDNNYKVTGLESVAIKWLEGFESTDFLVDCFEESVLMDQFIGSQVEYHGYFCEIISAEGGTVFLQENSSDLHFELALPKFLGMANAVEDDRERKESLNSKIQSASERAAVSCTVPDLRANNTELEM